MNRSENATSRLDAVLAEIDAANAEDPRRIAVDGQERPYETVYAERMTRRLEAMYPHASELLRIAARAQHLRRWEIPRADFPTGREGYNKWRKTCREHHARLVGEIMRRHGYSEDEIARVGMFLRKERLKKDPESQALENVVDVVFLEYYWDEFVQKYSDYDDDKLIDIVGKTLRKMSSEGHAAALALPLPERTKRIVEAAVAREADRLKAMAEAEKRRAKAEAAPSGEGGA